MLKKTFAALSAFFTPVRLVVTVLVLAFFWFMVLGDNGIYQFRRLLEMRQRLLSERQTLNARIDQLTREKQILQNPEDLEMAIRSELGYIKPGEVVFEAAKPAAPAAAPAPAAPADAPAGPVTSAR